MGTICIIYYYCYMCFSFAAFKKWGFETLSVNKSEGGGYKVRTSNALLTPLHPLTHNVISPSMPVQVSQGVGCMA